MSVWDTVVPGDMVVIKGQTRLEFPSNRGEIFMQKKSCAMCIAKTLTMTTTGLTVVKIFFLTFMGIGYKRFNAGGDRKFSNPQIIEKF
jgi:hypothetical protein